MSDTAVPRHLVVRSDRGDLPKVLSWVRAFIAAQRLADRAAMVLELAAEELVLNAMTHGRPADREGVIECSIELLDERGALRLVIEDEGSPFDPTAHATPEVEAPLEDRRIGGLGVHLVRTMAEVRYARLGDRNRVEVLIAADAR